MTCANPESNLKGRVWEGLVRQVRGRETWALADQAVVSATNFLTNVMLARFMGLREFGIFALAWMSVLFVNSIQYTLVILPMMSVAPKREQHDRPAYFGAVVFQELALVSAYFLLVFAGLRLVGNRIHHIDVGYLALPLAVSALIYQLQDFARRYFFVTAQNRRAFVDDVLSYLTQLPILFVLYWTRHLNSVTALWTMAGTSLLGLVAAWFWMEPLQFHWSRIQSVWSQHWKIARWLIPSAMLSWTSGNLFILAAPLYYGAAAVGVLKASQNLMGVTHVWFQGLENVVPAETARRLHQGGIRPMNAYIRSILFRWGAITVSYAALMSAAPGLWLRLVYGPQLAHYGYILQLYALYYILMFSGSPFRAGLLALEYTKPIFWSYVTIAALSISLAIPFAKHLGLNGVLIGLIGTQILFAGIQAGAFILRSNRMKHGEDRRLPLPAAAE